MYRYRRDKQYKKKTRTKWVPPLLLRCRWSVLFCGVWTDEILILYQNSRIFSNIACVQVTAQRVVWWEVSNRLWVPNGHLVSAWSLSRPSTPSLTTMQPCLVLVKVKWCIDLMPFKAHCQNGWSQKVAQSYVGTRTLPSCVPTSWACLTTADNSTTRTMSSKHPILIRLYSVA